MEQHPAWRDMALQAMSAEAHAQKMTNRGGTNFL